MLLRERELPQAKASEYQLDHRVPLALGDHPRNRNDLELQPLEGEAGAKKKDRLERRLQRLVCATRLPLQKAQKALYFGWQAATRSEVVEP